MLGDWVEFYSWDSNIMVDKPFRAVCNLSCMYHITPIGKAVLTTDYFFLSVGNPDG